MTTATLISSQEYRNDELIEAKRAAKDYTVTLGKVIEIDGQQYQIIIDGHHSYEAAKLDGADPEFTQATVTDCDREGIGDLDDYLEAHYVDCDYYEIETGASVF